MRFCIMNDQARTAFATINCALEIVLVDTATLTISMAFKDCLYFFPSYRIDNDGVLALILYIIISDDALIVWVKANLQLVVLQTTTLRVTLSALMVLTAKAPANVSLGSGSGGALR